VVINQVRPIYVTFAIPEQQLNRVRAALKQGGDIGAEATVPGGPRTGETGRLSFVDNAVDVTTGTIKLKATFDNKDMLLWPGQFADVALTLRQQADAVVVPSQSVQTGPEGSYVYVIQPDNTAVQRQVKIDRSLGAETVIRSGLQPNERIVVDGQLRLVPGAKVAPKPAP
jgi:multidrug efflux system membrane fusion protein